ncbi:MAG: O-succinylbenzoate--CoA ligase [Rhizobacter sp.]|nr:O-succinylbenzoate--CoA ligase [Rhizobacter sp.]
MHAPLVWWAAQRPQTLALDDGVLRLDFAQLAARVAESAGALEQAGASTTAWVDDSQEPGAQLLSFVAIVASGRTAAFGDPDWPPHLREQVRERVRQLLQPPHAGAATASSPFYIGFTSGSTGLPKGFRRSHGSWTSSFEICLQTFGAAASTPVLVPGRLSHSLFLFGAMLGLWTGAGVRLQSRFSATAALDTLRRGEAGCLVAVPSQLILMLEQARRHGMGPIEATQLVMIGGAPWARARTPELQALFPAARIIEFYGASETSFIAWADSDSTLPDTAVGRPFSNVELRVDPPAPGLIYVRSPMVFQDYVTLMPGEDSTAVLRDGDWLSVRDMGHIDNAGLLHLLGRQQRMLVTQGKNLFPEEVENMLAAHPALASVSIQGVPDALRGTQAVALLSLTAPVTSADLVAWCRARLEPYKTPRRFYVCSEWPRTLSGKTDHPALARMLTAHLSLGEQGGSSLSLL